MPDFDYDIRPNNEGLQVDIESLLNSYSRKNASNTPDFILAEYLRRCLEAFEHATRSRDEFYFQPDEQPAEGGA